MSGSQAERDVRDTQAAATPRYDMTSVNLSAALGGPSDGVQDSSEDLPQFLHMVDSAEEVQWKRLGVTRTYLGFVSQKDTPGHAKSMEAGSVTGRSGDVLLSKRSYDSDSEEPALKHSSEESKGAPDVRPEAPAVPARQDSEPPHAVWTTYSQPNMENFKMPTASELDKVGQVDGEPERVVGNATFDIPCPLNVPWFKDPIPHDGKDPASNFHRHFNYVKYLQLLPRLLSLAFHGHQIHQGGFIGAMGTIIDGYTFGLFEAVTAVPVPEETLLVLPGTPGEEEPTVVSGLRSVRLMRQWRDYMRDYTWPDAKTRLSRGRQVAQLLTAALQVFDMTDEEALFWYRSHVLTTAGATIEMTNVLSSLALFILALCGVSWAIWQDIPEMHALRDRLDKFHTWSFVKLMQFACHDSMVRSGWCEYTISFTRWGIDFQPTPRIISILCHLRPYFRGSELEHKNCTGSSCVFYTIDNPNEYVTRHDEPSCSCALIKPPEDDVRRILRDGHIPVVILDTSGDVPFLHVQPSTDDPYIAISHVWADGMGSTTEVGLPTCQVSRIATYARELLPESRAFWIDSLCIPGEGGFRKGAIQQMGRTYKEAAAVLVLDASMRAMCTKALVDADTQESTEEIFLRLALSGWMRRVWTLQEAMLAQRLFFEFADTLWGFTSTLNSFTTRLTPGLIGAERDIVASNLVSVTPAFSRNTLEEVPLGAAIGLLRGRNTSKLEDEIVAVSSLLPLNVSALLSIQGPNAAEERMREALIQLGRIHRLLPMTVGAKLSLPNFRWAPRSLAAIGAPVFMQGCFPDTAVCTKDGLWDWYNVVPLEPAIPNIAACFNRADSERTSATGGLGEGYFILADTMTHFRRTVHMRLPRELLSSSENKGMHAVDYLMFPPDETLRTTVPCLLARRLPRGSSGSADSDGRGGNATLHCDYVAGARLLAGEWPQVAVEVGFREEQITKQYVRLM